MAQKTDCAKTKVGRDHVDYWKARLATRTYEVERTDRRGNTVTETHAVPNFQVRLSYLGRREWFPLHTTNQSVGANKAREIYRSLVAKGWDATLAVYKPDMVVTGDGATVGEFLSQVKAVTDLKPQTFAIYSRKFRTLVAGVCGIKAGNEKHNYVGTGYKDWLAKIHAVKIEKLTSDRINEWKLRELNDPDRNPAERKHTGTTLRSILLSSKALFTIKLADGTRDDIRNHITVKLPEVSPFERVALPKARKSRYKGLGNDLTPALLVQAAQSELATDKPEEFKVFLLSLGAGLRRDEIDTLEWNRMLWQENKIRVETTEHGATKSEDSESDVEVDPAMMALLKGYLPKPGTKASKFVVVSPVAPRANATTYHHYRCDRIFKNLIKWLRSKGLAGRTPIHTLRKECGSQICKTHGIFAASVALRHSNISVTREHYLDDGAVSAAFQIGKLFSDTKAA